MAEIQNLLAPELRSLPLESFMHLALDEADQAGQAGDLPIGAVVVLDGEVISRGRSQRNSMLSKIRHAELEALLGGGEPLWFNCRRAVLFTTLEPCVMCLGAAVMADVPHIIYALGDENVQNRTTLAANPYVHRHIHSYFGGVLAEDSRSLLQRYQPDLLDFLLKQARLVDST